MPATRCAAPKGTERRWRPDGDWNTTEVAESLNPSDAPDRSSTIRLRTTTEADDARTSRLVDDNENARTSGADVSPAPTWVKLTPGVVNTWRFPTWSTSVTPSMVHVPCSDHRGNVTPTT